MSKKQGLSFLGMAVAVGFLAMGLSGCSHPRYMHTYTTTYDPNGNVTKTEDAETIIQDDPSAGPLKVKIAHKNKIEQ